MAPEQRDADRGDRRRGGLRPYAGYRERALAGLVAERLPELSGPRGRRARAPRGVGERAPSGGRAAGRAAICHGDDGSAARSGSGSASSGTARNLFFALVLDATAHSRCTAVKPKAAFYILPKLDVKKFNITDDEQFALDLLHEKHILITRGGGFNWEKPDHFRIVYLPRMGVLHEAMEDLADFLAHYRQR